MTKSLIPGPIKKILAKLYSAFIFGIKNANSKKNVISFKIYSFYNNKIDQDIPKSQRKVFEKFGYKINQIKDSRLRHPEFMNKVTRAEKGTDYLIFFDIDCIPTSPDTIIILLQQLKDNRTLAGAAQTANHIDDGRNLYIGPFFLGVSTQMLRELSYPDFTEQPGFVDVAQKLTEIVKSNDKYKINYWWPTHIETPKWKLLGHEMGFGLGTEYEGLVYHAFESRVTGDSRFVLKCEEVLKKYNG